ncbi:hypothetical protein [Hyphomicrobium sp. DY-1]|uniref:hypothetical protein n=1 Tax=Hyphomicrobium sp. DY-1 TaxID=3075650 RepID=UPI0039C2C128
MSVSADPETPPRAKTRAHPKYRRLVRPLVDAVAAGLLFTIVSSTLICNHAKAGIVPAAFIGVAQAAQKSAAEKAVAQPGPQPIVQIATATSSADAVYRQTSVMAAWGLLGVAFSLMTALNLAILRHLKRAYAVPARRFPPTK